MAGGEVNQSWLADGSSHISIMPGERDTTSSSALQSFDVAPAQLACLKCRIRVSL